VAALLFMARTSTLWNLLPAKELGCGSATTCWRRLDEWARAGVFEQLQAVLLDELGEAGRLDLSGSWSTPPASARSKGALTGANPVDRGKQGTKPHLAGDAGGLPLAVVLTAANAHDSTMLGAVVDDIPPIRMPTRRPGTVHADKGYDYPRCRAELRRRGITPRIARRRVESSQRLGRHRWRIERTIAWLLGWRRLRVRYERCDKRFFTFAMLACSAILFNTLSSHPGDRSECPLTRTGMVQSAGARWCGR
jgi:transposase